MKKYMAPVAKVVKVNNTEILAGSLPSGGTTDENLSKRGRNSFIFEDDDYED